MPYIIPPVRHIFDPTLGIKRLPENAGQLNFAITCLIKAYFKSNGANYQAINDVVGALTSAKDEFYRRVAVPYEEQKIKENGDVYND